MGIHYLHLDKRERTLIKDWHGQGLRLREIGRRLRRDHTTISRELKRNLWCGQHYYITEQSNYTAGACKVALNVID